MALPAPAPQKPVWLRQGYPSLHHLFLLFFHHHPPSQPLLNLQPHQYNPSIPRRIPQSSFSAWPGNASRLSDVSLLLSFLDRKGEASLRSLNEGIVLFFTLCTCAFMSCASPSPITFSLPLHSNIPFKEGHIEHLKTDLLNRITPVHLNLLPSPIQSP